MSTTNYTADKECNPTSVTFANGRRVWLNAEGFLDVGWAEGHPQSAEFPKPCELCNGHIESKEDFDWHGLGNCVPICSRCFGSGIDPAGLDYEQQYNRVMSLLRNMKLEHGQCQPRERRACTACNAKEDLEILLANYKGARIILSQKR